MSFVVENIQTSKSESSPASGFIDQTEHTDADMKAFRRGTEFDMVNLRTRMDQAG